MLQAIYRKVLG